MTDLELEIPYEHQSSIFGQFDANIKRIEKALSVRFILRNDKLKVAGPKNSVSVARDVVLELYELSKRGTEITEQTVDYALSIKDQLDTHPMAMMDEDTICHALSGKPIKPKTLGQKRYVDAIREKMIVFGIGPAGTGKTYLAMAMAIKSEAKRS